MSRWIVVFSLGLGSLAVATGTAQARIVHDGSCASGYADDTYNKGAGTGRHVCIPRGHVSPVARSRCESRMVVRKSQCVPEWEKSDYRLGARGRPPHKRRIVHD